MTNCLFAFACLRSHDSNVNKQIAFKSDNWLTRPCAAVVFLIFADICMRLARSTSINCCANRYARSLIELIHILSFFIACGSLIKHFSNKLCQLCYQIQITRENRSITSRIACNEKFWYTKTLKQCDCFMKHQNCYQEESRLDVICNETSDLKAMMFSYLTHENFKTFSC